MLFSRCREQNTTFLLFLQRLIPIILILLPPNPAPTALRRPGQTMLRHNFPGPNLIEDVVDEGIAAFGLIRLVLIDEVLLFVLANLA